MNTNEIEENDSIHEEDDSTTAENLGLSKEAMMKLLDFFHDFFELSFPKKIVLIAIIETGMTNWDRPDAERDRIFEKLSSLTHLKVQTCYDCAYWLSGNPKWKAILDKAHLAKEITIKKSFLLKNERAKPGEGKHYQQYLHRKEIDDYFKTH